MINKKITIRPEEHKDYKSIISLILRSFQEGTNFAFGDNARVMIAIGDTQAIGSVYQKSSEFISQNTTVMILTQQDIATVKDLIDTIVPTYLSWAKEITIL